MTNKQFLQHAIFVIYYKLNETNKQFIKHVTYALLETYVM